MDRRDNVLPDVFDYEVCLRVPLLFALDLTLNGFVATATVKAYSSLFDFAPAHRPHDIGVPVVYDNASAQLSHGVNDTAQRTIPELSLMASLFHPDRLKVVRIWLSLPVREFVWGSLLHMAAVMTLGALCMLPGGRLAQFYRWVIPLSALLFSIAMDHFVVETLVDAVVLGKTSIRGYVSAFGLVCATNFLLLKLYFFERRRGLAGNNLKWWYPLTLISFLGVPLISPVFCIFAGLKSMVRLLLDYLHIPLIVLEFDIIFSAMRSISQSLTRTLRTLRIQADDNGLRIALDNRQWRVNLVVSLRALFFLRLLFHSTFLIADSTLPMKDELSTAVWSNETYVNWTSASNTSTQRPTGMSKLELALSYLAVRSCDTSVAVLSTTAVISDVGHFLASAFMYVLDSPQTEDSSTAGMVFGVLFVMLALQSSITNVDPQKRLLRLYRGAVLQLTGLIHLFGRILDESFQRVSAAGVRASRLTLARLIGCSLWIILTIVALVRYLFSDITGAWSSPWILSVSLFSIDVIIRVVLAMLVFHCHIRLNAASSEEAEDLETKVFALKMFGSIIELIVGVLLLGNGMFILATDYGGLIRLALMSLHAYGNIWLQGNEVVASWRRRKAAGSKIGSLETVGREELSIVNDKCTICQEDMIASAKRTACRHYFHGGCLKRWLYLQDVCPICHATVGGAPANQGAAEEEDAEE